MSQENVEVVRRAFDALLRGDYERAAECFHPDAVWHNTSEFPGQRTCVGPEAMIDFWQTLGESFEASGGGTEVERVVEGKDSVVLGVQTLGRGKTSGVPLDVHWGMAFQLRAGRVSRVDVHGNWSKALNAAGL